MIDALLALGWALLAGVVAMVVFLAAEHAMSALGVEDEVIRAVWAVVTAIVVYEALVGGPL